MDALEVYTIKKLLVLLVIFLLHAYSSYAAAAGRCTLQRIVPTFVRTQRQTFPAVSAFASSRSASGNSSAQTAYHDKQIERLIQADEQLEQAGLNLVNAIRASGKSSRPVKFLIEETPKLLEQAKEDGVEAEIEIRKVLSEEYTAIALEIMRKNDESFWVQAAQYLKSIKF